MCNVCHNEPCSCPANVQEQHNQQPQEDVSAEQPCPLPEFELVELVEVVTQDKEKWVKGAGMPTTEITEHVERTDKDGEHFKQYINLKKDLETQDKRHPEYGREITFRARVKRKDDKKESLDGVTVTFKSKCTKAANRAAPDAAIWSDPNAKFTDNDQKEGFGSKGGGEKTSANTDGKGWTTPVTFYLSQYGGDQFEISAELDPSVKGASGTQPKKTKQYIVWRKFWYQMTSHDDLGARQPTIAEGYFAEVFAEMVKANEIKFKKSDFTEDSEKEFVKRTFHKEYMLKQGGSDSVVANVGADSNIDQFGSHDKLKIKTETEHPVKVNLIVSKFQLDPLGSSTLSEFDLKSNGQEVLIEKGTGGPIVSQPAIKKNAKLVVSGEWGAYTTPIPSPPTLPEFIEKGTITDECITINSTRDNTLKVKVDLTNATATNGTVPTPSDLSPVPIRLKVETAKGYGGWAPAAGIVATFDGTDGNFKTFNLTVAHEVGHKFVQVPEPTKQAKSLKDHPQQYVKHGGSGSHCRSGATSCSSEANITISRDVATTIATSTADPKNTHHVTSNVGFILGHKVTVKALAREIVTRVAGSKLKFTTNFVATADDPVIQKLTYGDAVGWNDGTKKAPKPIGGTCAMYHARNSVKDKFCDTCKPYLQLQDMSKFK